MNYYVGSIPINNQSEFMHYGIKGMKWGVRRSPEQLGHREARTPWGKKKQKRQAEEQKLKNKSDQELRTELNRLHMEEEYRRLTGMNKNGKKIAKSVLKTVGTLAIIPIVKGSMNKAVVKPGIDALADMMKNVGSISVDAIKNVNWLKKYGDSFRS